MTKNKKIELPEKLVNAQMQFKKIELLQSSINATFEQVTDFNFDITVDTQVDEPKSLIFSIVSVNITNAAKSTTYGTLVASCIYGIENFGEVLVKDAQGGIQVPVQLVEILNNISISTTRGIMFSTFKGTFLHNAIMPLVNTQQIVTRVVTPENERGATVNNEG